MTNTVSPGRSESLVTLTILGHGCFINPLTVTHALLKWSMGIPRDDSWGHLCTKNIPPYPTVQHVLLPDYQSCYPSQYGNFLFFLLVYWYKEPRITSGSCSFNFSGKLKKQSSSWGLSTHKAWICRIRKHRFVKWVTSQLQVLADSHLTSMPWLPDPHIPPVGDTAPCHSVSSSSLSSPSRGHSSTLSSWQLLNGST